jgi:hypothetical protein
MLEQFIEVLKYTIPALIVLATAYLMLKSYLDDNYRTYALNQRTEAQKITLPVRLQAYERLTLLCDRISIPNTLLRIRMPGMTVADLSGALMIAVSHEFDHNAAQQLYVSPTLWQILLAAKNDTLSLISQATEGLDPAADSDVLVSRLLAAIEERGDMTPLNKSLMAIRTEAGQLF